MLDRCVGLVLLPLTLSLALTPTPTRAPALPLTRRVGGRRKQQRRQHGEGRVAPGFGFWFGLGLGLGLGLGRQVVCTWLQVMEALGANKTIEHIGLFGNHDNMERPHVQSAPPPPPTHPPQATHRPGRYATRRARSSGWRGRSGPMKAPRGDPHAQRDPRAPGCLLGPREGLEAREEREARARRSGAHEGLRWRPRGVA